MSQKPSVKLLYLDTVPKSEKLKIDKIKEKLLLISPVLYP